MVKKSCHNNICRPFIALFFNFFTFWQLFTAAAHGAYSHTWKRRQQLSYHPKLSPNESQEHLFFAMHWNGKAHYAFSQSNCTTLPNFNVFGLDICLFLHEIWLILLEIWLILHEIWLILPEIWLISPEIWLIILQIWLIMIETWLILPEIWLILPKIWFILPEIWLILPEIWLILPEIWLILP